MQGEFIQNYAARYAIPKEYGNKHRTRANTQSGTISGRFLDSGLARRQVDFLKYYPEQAQASLNSLEHAVSFEPQSPMVWSVSSPRMTTKPLASKKKALVTKKRTIKTMNIILNFGRPTLYILITMLACLLILGTAIRFSFISKVVSRINTISRLIVYSTNIYIDLSETTLIVAETILWNNTSQYRFSAALDMFTAKRKHAAGEVLKPLEELLSYDTSSVSLKTKELLSTPFCDMVNLVTKTHYPSCDTAMSGIGKNPLLQYLNLYYNVLEKLLSEWRLISRLESRYELLRKDEYLGIFAYATQDIYGSAETIYYFLVEPLYTQLTESLDSNSSVSNLANILYAMWVAVVGITLITSLCRRISKLQLNYWLLFQCTPLDLLKTNSLVNPWMKRHSGMKM